MIRAIFYFISIASFCLGVSTYPRNGGTSTDAANLDYTPANAQSWGNYMVQVGYLLQKDAQELYNSWTKSYEGGKAYKDLFLSHEIETGDEEDE